MPYEAHQLCYSNTNGLRSVRVAVSDQTQTTLGRSLGFCHYRILLNRAKYRHCGTEQSIGYARCCASRCKCDPKRRVVAFFRRSPLEENPRRDRSREKSARDVQHRPDWERRDRQR